EAQKQIVVAVGRLRPTQEQITARPKGEMKRLGDPLLNRAIQVDQQVATADEIQVRERWIFDHVVVREQHQLAEFTPDAVAGRLALKETVQPLFGDVCN